MKNNNTNNLNLENIIKTIESATTRTEVEDAITNLKKKDLIVIAKYFNVYIGRSDKVDMIIKKVIENTVGYKLRSDAINSIDLRSNYDR